MSPTATCATAGAFAVQLWLFASPVAYPASLLPERFGLNGLAGGADGLRWALLGQAPPSVRCPLRSWWPSYSAAFATSAG